MPFGLTEKVRASISLRIALLFCLTFSLSLIAALGISYFQLSYSLNKSGKEILSSKMRETSTLLLSQGPKGLKNFLSEEKNRILNAGYMIRLLTKSGETIYIKPSVQEKNFDFEAAFKKTDAPEKLLGWSSLAAIDDEDVFDILTEKVGDEYYLQVGRSNEDHEDVLGQMLGVFLATGAIFILLSAGLGLWYARKSLAPLRSLLSTIKSLETGDLSKRVLVAGPKDELYDLGETFNRMIARIEKLVEVMRESLDNVAHDIRTPLTRIRAIAEDVLTSNNPMPLNEALQDCAENAAEVSELVGQLMSISEADAGMLSVQYADTNLRILLDDVAEIYDFVGQEKAVGLSIECEEGLHWSLDRKRIKQALGNLVDNAIKFSPAKTTVQLSAYIEMDLLRIDVKDNGIGVSENDLTRIWDRLFRGDKSRTTKGLGLGLSIVRSIIMAHNGEVDAKCNVEGGMTFSFRIPKPSTNVISK